MGGMLTVMCWSTTTQLTVMSVMLPFHTHCVRTLLLSYINTLHVIILGWLRIEGWLRGQSGLPTTRSLAVGMGSKARNRPRL